MNIDRQRYAAVRELEALGHRWDGLDWRRPGEVIPDSLSALIVAADAMHDGTGLRSCPTTGLRAGPDVKAVADASPDLP